MHSEISDEALELGKVVTEVLESQGGVDFLRRSVRNPSLRSELVEILAPVGIWDLDTRRGQIELEAVATAVRACGHVALPYPVAEYFAGRGGRSLFLVPSGGDRLVAHVDLAHDADAVTLDGAAFHIVGAGEPLATKLGPFAGPVELGSQNGNRLRDAALLVTLQGWWLLGLLDNALKKTALYTKEREQFGRTLIRFDTVGFRLADMTVAVNGLDELAKYTLWAVNDIGSADEAAMIDALSLRTASLEAAAIVLRGTHQLHGAMGFTDEVDVSWLSKASQGIRRLPEGESQTVARLERLIKRVGYAGVLNSEPRTRLELSSAPA